MHETSHSPCNIILPGVRVSHNLYNGGGEQNVDIINKYIRIRPTLMVQSFGRCFCPKQPWSFIPHINTSGALWGSLSSSRTLQHIERSSQGLNHHPLSLMTNPLYHLSYSHPSDTGISCYSVKWYNIGYLYIYISRKWSWSLLIPRVVINFYVCVSLIL